MRTSQSRFVAALFCFLLVAVTLRSGAAGQDLE